MVHRAHVPVRARLGRVAPRAVEAGDFEGGQAGVLIWRRNHRTLARLPLQALLSLPPSASSRRSFHKLRTDGSKVLHIFCSSFFRPQGEKTKNKSMKSTAAKATMENSTCLRNVSLSPAR